jgi:hypothetical protein
MLPKTAMQKTKSRNPTGPNFVHLHDREQDPVKLFKKYHIAEK